MLGIPLYKNLFYKTLNRLTNKYLRVNEQMKNGESLKKMKKRKKCFPLNINIK